MVNGKVLTVDSQFSVREAIAIGDGKIAAVGSNSDVRKLAGPNARVIDLQGRTVIPGLIDSHMHAIRAATTFSTEVNWIGAPSLTEALRPRARSCGDDEAGLVADRGRRLEPASSSRRSGGRRKPS